MDENLQARIRGADILPGLAAKHGLIFTNNGNKTEVALGYATLYGDVNGAIAPIADLYKPQIVALARYLNEQVYGKEIIPGNLLDGSVVPSAELSDTQDVTKGLGDPIKYGYHDAVLRQLIEYRHHPSDLLGWFLDGTLSMRWVGATTKSSAATSPIPKAGSRIWNGSPNNCTRATSNASRPLPSSSSANAPSASTCAKANYRTTSRRST